MIRLSRFRFKGELFGIGSNHTKYKNDRGMGNKVVQVLGQGVSVGASGNGTGNSSHHAYSSPNMNSNSGGGHYSGNYQSAQVISPLPVDDSSSHGQPSHSASLDAGY